MRYLRSPGESAGDFLAELRGNTSDAGLHPDGYDPGDSLPSMLTAAGKLFVEGAFNVNSTSVEALVQRRPEFVDGSEPPAAPLYEDIAGGDFSSALDAMNETMGRRFEVISFRWLDEET